MLNAEPGRPENAVVTGRKAGIFMRFDVTGKAAHAGANFEHGVSAIDEIAHKIAALHALTDLEQGITVNVGVVSGGQTVNTVAPSAKAEIDLRYIDPADRDATLAKVKAIMAHATVPGTSASFEIYAEFLPLVQTPDAKRLFELYADCGQRAGRDRHRHFHRRLLGCRLLRRRRRADDLRGRADRRRTHSPDEYVELGIAGAARAGSGAHDHAQRRVVRLNSPIGGALAVPRGVEPPTFGLGNRFAYRFVNDLQPDVANVLHLFPRHEIRIAYPRFVAGRASNCDVCFAPDKRTFAGGSSMSAKCQKRTFLSPRNRISLSQTAASGSVGAIGPATYAQQLEQQDGPLTPLLGGFADAFGRTRIC